MSELDRFSFKIDGCLSIFNQAVDEKEAKEKMQQSWPRSSIEFIGVNMPASLRTMPVTKKVINPVVHRPKAESAESILAKVERSVVDAYAGH